MHAGCMHGSCGETNELLQKQEASCNGLVAISHARIHRVRKTQSSVAEKLSKPRAHITVSCRKAFETTNLDVMSHVKRKNGCWWTVGSAPQQLMEIHILKIIIFIIHLPHLDGFSSLIASLFFCVIDMLALQSASKPSIQRHKA